MCCDAWNNGPHVDQCPDCGEDVDEDGDAVSGCNYSSTSCHTCGAATCDGSC